MTPEINVQFILDSEGNPVFIEHDNVKHYRIEISLQNIPDDVYATNYQLHPSYISPFREETDKNKNFRFATTTYGDYSLSASLLGKSRNYLTSGIISKALEDRYVTTNNQKIKDAITEISDH